MTYKLTEQDCQNILKDDVQAVHDQELQKLYAELIFETEIHSIYRLQGRIAQLLDEMSLKDKAFNQLN